MSTLDGFKALDEAWTKAEERCKALVCPFAVSVPIETDDPELTGYQLGWGRIGSGKFQLVTGSDEKGWNNLIGGSPTEVRILAVKAFPALFKALCIEAQKAEHQMKRAACELTKLLEAE